MTGQPSSEDFLRLVRLLENYQHLIDVLLGHYDGSSGDEKICQMCLEQPRTGYKHCDECKKVARKLAIQKSNAGRRRRAGDR